MPRVVILGGGFGGLAAARALKRSDADVVLVDRQNHHLFQPLLYQVATAGLGATDIAQPIRSILAHQRNVTVHMGSVDQVDLAARLVHVSTRPQPIEYDAIVIALGVETDYFGHDEWSKHALGLKSLRDATRIRARLLHAFERAENTDDESLRQRLLTTVIIGAGPTGIEMAGALAELARVALRRDFRRIDPASARVVLLEGGPRILPAFHSELSASAERTLRAMGVEVHRDARVEQINAGPVVTFGGSTIEAGNVVWAAGVRAPALTTTLGVDLDRQGRIIVGPDARIPGHDEAFAIGDIACLTDANGVCVPGLCQGAMQEGDYVGTILSGGIARGAASEHSKFRYRDKGIMATIGRSRAVIQTKRMRHDGFVAWLIWLFVHLIFLIDFRSKLAVLTQWCFAYVTFRPGARLIYRPDDSPDAPDASDESTEN